MKKTKENTYRRLRMENVAAYTANTKKNNRFLLWNQRNNRKTKNHEKACIWILRHGRVVAIFWRKISAVFVVCFKLMWHCKMILFIQASNVVVAFNFGICKRAVRWRGKKERVKTIENSSGKQQRQTIAFIIPCNFINEATACVWVRESEWKREGEVEEERVRVEFLFVYRSNCSAKYAFGTSPIYALENILAKSAQNENHMAVVSGLSTIDWVLVYES